ncbi:MAG: dockerin type I repeat-containing protein [Clostridia bacterium]|nr:dockerin type I repeat-containing protein [Clostridia bacterium]
MYNLKGVENGTYTLEVSAENHVTREYTVTIGDEAVNLDIQINHIGDINGDGKITVLDYNKVLKHVKKTGNLDDYERACADVDGNGKVMVSDYARILRHVKKTDLLW